MNKNPLSDLYYDKVFLAEKHGLDDNKLQNSNSDQVGKLPKEDLFSSTPKIEGDGPDVKDVEKVAKGPQYKQTTGLGNKIDAPKQAQSKGQSKMPNSAPAKSSEAPKAKEMEDTDVDPTEDESEEKQPAKKSYIPKKKELNKENYNMSAFETLFKKTINEEVDETDFGGEDEGIGDIGLEGEGPDDALDLDQEDEGGESEEGDLVSDLKDLQDKLASILSKLEGELDNSEFNDEGDEYSEDQFDEEFSPEEGEEGEEEEEEVKESLGKPQVLSQSKGKKLQQKSNKVGGKLSSAKKGKAYIGKLKSEPKPKALGDKKAPLMKGTQAGSNIKKGEFFQ